MGHILRINEITKEELQILNDIDKKCLEMHICPPPKTFINMKVNLPNGDLLVDYSFRSKSWVRNMYHYLLGKFCCTGNGDSTFVAGKTTTKQVNGTIVDLNVSYDLYWNMNNSSTTNSYGIVVGISTDAESFESYSLKTIVASGTGAGQLSHIAQSGNSVTYTAGTKTWAIVITRLFNNNSGGTISIAETAIYEKTITNLYYMVCRDLLGVAVDVVDTAQLTVTYTIEQVLPA
jgi:hypothetical protein